MNFIRRHKLAIVIVYTALALILARNLSNISEKCATYGIDCPIQKGSTDGR